MNKIDTLHSKGIIPKASLYVRFSSDNQREESIEAQLRALREFCERNNIIIIHEYADRAKSATTDDRPAFLQMINDAKLQEFNLLIVHKLDRFSRNRYDSAYYKRELRKNGVSLISVLEQMDDSPESVILESVLEGMSEYYSKNLAREVMKGMRESALKCQAVGGRAPFGYSINSITHKYEIDENEADAVRYIFNSIMTGSGYLDIIHNLNIMGYKTRNGNPFGKNSIHEILKNEKYKGVYIFNRSAAKCPQGTRNHHKNKNDDEIIRIPGGMPAIINEDVFDNVYSIMFNRRQKEQHGTAKENYMLAGKIFCGECGASFNGNKKWAGRNKTLHVTYRCNTRKSKGTEICQNKEIRKEYIESFIMHEVEKIVFNDDYIPELIKSYQEYTKTSGNVYTKDIARLKGQLKEVEKQIGNIVSVIAKTASTALIESLSEFENQKHCIKEKLTHTVKNSVEREIHEESIRAAYNTAKEMYRNGTLEEKKRLINLYLDKVIVYQEHIEIFLNMVPDNLVQIRKEQDGLADESESLHTKNQKNIFRSVLLTLDEYIRDEDVFVWRINTELNENLCKKKNLNSAKISKIETFRGGGEGS